MKSYDSYGSYGSSSSYPSEFFSSPEFSIKDLYKATDNFSAANVVGTGSFGTVYKGKLKDGSLVAVKRAKRVRSSSLNLFSVDSSKLWNRLSSS